MTKSSRAKVNSWKHKLRDDFMKECKSANDWDYSYLVKIELTYLKRLLYSIEKQEVVEKDYCVKYLKWAINCLEYVCIDYLFYDYISKGEPHKLTEMDKSYYKLKTSINIRNYERFMDKGIFDNESDFLKDSLKIELYRRKAWKLYCRIREEHTMDWWW